MSEIPKFKQIELRFFSSQKHICIITLNREDRLNAFSYKLSVELTKALQWAGRHKTIHTIVITGKGKFYSAGNDLKGVFPFLTMKKEQQQLQAASVVSQTIIDLANAFIECPKILVAAVNGGCFGIAATTMALCDFVYASEKAVFQTPFMALGLSAEGCSSFTYPQMMGKARANRLLLLGERFNAKQAYESGLISEYFPHDQFYQELEKRLLILDKYSRGALMDTKEITSRWDRGKLVQVNHDECQVLSTRLFTEESLAAIKRFANKGKPKSKL